MWHIHGYVANHGFTSRLRRSCRGPAASESLPIGYLNDSSLGPFEKIRAEAFQQALRDLGYLEGKNLVIEWRYGEGKSNRVRAVEVHLNVDVSVTAGGATRAAKEATVTIPIVMTQDADPGGAGFVASPSAARREHYGTFLSFP